MLRMIAYRHILFFLGGRGIYWGHFQIWLRPNAASMIFWTKTCDYFWGFFFRCWIHSCHLQVVSNDSSRRKSLRPQNCLKISISKYSYVLCLFIGFWDCWSHFWYLSMWLLNRCRPSLLIRRPSNHIWERGQRLRCRIHSYVQYLHIQELKSPEAVCNLKNGS